MGGTHGLMARGDTTAQARRSIQAPLHISQSNGRASTSHARGATRHATTGQQSLVIQFDDEDLSEVIPRHYCSAVTSHPVR